MKQVPYNRSFIHNAPKPFAVRLEQFPTNRKAVYVESVCKVLIESRFGPGYSYSFLDTQYDAPAYEPMSFLDLLEQEFVPSYAMEYLGRTSRGTSGSILENPARSKGISQTDTSPGQNFATLATDSTTRSPATLGRGSPTHAGRTSTLASSFASLAGFA